MGKRRVVITGLGALTPIGNQVASYWQSLTQGVSGAGPITSFDATRHKTQFACELKNYQPEAYFDSKEIKKMDLCTQYALIACDEALQDAGLLSDSFHPERVGVIWGSGVGGFKSIEDNIKSFVYGNEVPRFSPFFIPKFLVDITPGHISIKYGFTGPNFATVSACASSINALITAYQLILLNQADIIVAGGSEAVLTDCGLGGFNALKALSQRNDSPQTASRPFDKDRDGFVLGEGAGVLILEAHHHALARGAKIYAELVGTGMSADAHHITAPHPRGAAAALRYALQSAELQPQDVDYINAHATSTPLGDSSEVQAIQQVFGEHAYQLNISSTKSMTGHLLGAAGAIESIACILAIQHQLIPPTINHYTVDEALDPQLNFTFNQAQPRNVHVVQNNAFGFGGHNTSVIFKKWEASSIY